jgi:transcriptional regulator with XRE-family HTH domain
MKREIDDYELDINFGYWLKDQRISAGFTLEEAAKKSNVSIQRLKSLEMGYAERGITQAESERLCAVYQIALEDFLKRASGEVLT